MKYPIDPELKPSRFDFAGEPLTEEDIEPIMEEGKSIEKGLTPDQKRLHWEAYAQKTARQEEMFKRVFENIFDEQKGQIIGHFEKMGTIDSILLNSDIEIDKTSQKLQPAIELVYHSAFKDAV